MARLHPVVKSHSPPLAKQLYRRRRRVDQVTYARRTAAKAATPATAMEPPKVLAEPVKAMGEPVGLATEPVAGAAPEP